MTINPVTGEYVPDELNILNSNGNIGNFNNLGSGAIAPVTVPKWSASAISTPQSNSSNFFSTVNMNQYKVPTVFGTGSTNMSLDGTSAGTNTTTTSTTGDKSFLPENLQGWFGLGSNALSALTGLANYFNGRKALKLAQDQFNMQRNAYLDNRNTQANLINQSLQDRLNTRYLQNTGSTNGANEEYERRKLSMLNSI